MYNNQVRFGPTPTISPRPTINRQQTPYVPPYTDTLVTNNVSGPTQVATIKQQWVRPLPDIVQPIYNQQPLIQSQGLQGNQGYMVRSLINQTSVGQPIKQRATSRSPRKGGCGCGAK